MTGTVTTMLVSLQLVMAALTVPKVTEPVVVPKPDPLIVTDVPFSPLEGFKLLMNGAPNITPLLWIPPLVTTTLPIPAPVGTTATTEVSDQLEVVAVSPLNVTVPAVVPRLLPEMVTDVPAAPRFGLRPLINGGSTLKAKALLWTALLFVTTTGPLPAPLGTTATMLVSDQLETVPAVPLNFTVPALDPNEAPAMVTDVPGFPLEGLRERISGAFSVPSA